MTHSSMSSVQPNSIELQPLLDKKMKMPKRNATQLVDLSLSAANGTSLAFIYAFRQFLPKLFMNTARFILQPFNAAVNLIRAIVSWYEAHKEGYKKPAVLKAIIATITGVGIATALIGALVAGATFAVVGPFLSMSSFALRSLYLFGVGIYHGLLYLKTKDPKDKAKAISNVVNAVAVACNAIAIGLVLIALKASFGILGIVSGAMTALIALYTVATLKPPASSSSAEAELAKKNSTLKSNSSSAKRVYSHDDLSLLQFKERPKTQGRVSHNGIFSARSATTRGPGMNPEPPVRLIRSYSI